MSDLEYLLKLVRIQKGIASELMTENPYPSHVHVESRGSVGAYNTVETYINNLIFKNARKET